MESRQEEWQTKGARKSVDICIFLISPRAVRHRTKHKHIESQAIMCISDLDSNINAQFHQNNCTVIYERS